MLEERYEEFRGQVRDPYPAIGEKAVGKWGRVLSVFSITLTLYGGGCVFIVLISQMLMSLMAGVGLQLTLCQWMVVTACCLTPLTWMGSPKDFWPIAVGALITTCVACILIVTKCILLGTEMETITYPAPSAEGFFKGRQQKNSALILRYHFQPLDQSCLHLLEHQHFPPFKLI